MSTGWDVRKDIEEAQHYEPPLTGQTMAAELRRRADILRAEADQMQEASQLQRKDPSTGMIRDRDWLRLLAFEFGALADRVHVP